MTEAARKESRFTHVEVVPKPGKLLWYVAVNGEIREPGYIDYETARNRAKQIAEEGDDGF